MTFWDGYMIVGVQFGLGVALSSLTPPPQSFLRHPRRPIEPGWRCLDG